MKSTRHIATLLSIALLVLTASLAFAATSAPQTENPTYSLQSTATVPSTSTAMATATATSTLSVTDTVTATLNISSTLSISKTTTPEPTRVAHATPAPVPPGKNPETAIEPTGKWWFIEPGATHWYKVTDNRLKLDLWLKANQQEGLGLAIFAPEQTDLYGKPIGRGAYNKFQPDYDLFWSGRTVAYGTWFATVTNYKAIPISYSLGYERKSTRPADACAACHGYIIVFEDCVSDNGFCDRLQDDYK